MSSTQKEVCHYVVTAHAPGAVLQTAQCNFLSPHSLDVLVAKSRRLEVRQLRQGPLSESSPFPVVLSVPVNGRIVSLLPVKIPNSATSLVFVLTDRLHYAVVAYDPSSAPPPYPLVSHAQGSFQKGEDVQLGRPAEAGPLVAADHWGRCLALHLYDGLITILPIDRKYQPLHRATKGGGGDDDKVPARSQVLKEAFHCRMEERTVLAMAFLQSKDSNQMPMLALLHQDARGAQHVITHVVNLPKKQLHLYGSQSVAANTEWLKKTSVDGGSSLLIPTAPVSPAAPAAASAVVDVEVEENNQDLPPSATKMGGLLILGQRQFTYCSTTATKVVPVPQALFLSYEVLPPDPNSGCPRYLLGDEFGNLHMLTLITVNEKVVALQIDTLGSCTLSTSLSYLGDGLLYVGSALGDSQLVQIHDEPIQLEEEEETLELADTTYLSMVEEYTNLGPILDFDLVPTAPSRGGSSSSSQHNYQQSQVVTASGSSKSGSLRLIRNGIGMNEYASVEIPGIQNMWSLRKSLDDTHDSYLVQSFVGETRVLGVTTTTTSAGAKADDDAMLTDEAEEAVGGALEEVELPGLDPMASTLYMGNVLEKDCLLQITDNEIRFLALESGTVLDQWHGQITVATANEAGQIAVSLRGGLVLYFCIENNKLKKVFEKQMDREVGCLNLNPFSADSASSSAMDLGDKGSSSAAQKSSMLAVGLWDDYTVRLLSLDSSLDELLCIHLSSDDNEEAPESGAGSSPSRRNRNNMMARSLCLITMDFSSSNVSSSSGSNSSGAGVNMLFVGLGDGTLISFAVLNRNGKISVHAKKEVCLGTQRIDLVPLSTERGGTCVLATGDRPTVIYLAGVGGTSSNQFNPKLCYSSVNLAVSEDDEGDDVSRPPSQQTIAVNVAAAFFSPLLFDAASMGTQRYSLCVADDSNLRLGVIDDIQKLHVTTCRLGMAPRRVVHCPDGHLFAIGCIESGIKQFGLGSDESNMGNVLRFMDETSFDDIERVDLEPYEMILSMVYASMKVPKSGESTEVTVTAEGENTNASNYKSFLLVGTAYALPDEDEPTRGRILVYSCEATESGGAGSDRAVCAVTEFSTNGGVYSMCQFYDGKVLCTVNTKALLLHLVDDATGAMKLEYLGVGHHGHILSLAVKSLAKRQSSEADADSSGSRMSVQASDSQKEQAKKKDSTVPKEQLAIVGDLMRSIGLVQYYPEHQTLEEVARDFNGNWTTAIEMLTENVYLGAENWCNLFCLRRNYKATAEEVRCRLDTIGEFHFGEMCNKFMRGSLVMPVSSNSNSGGSGADAKNRRLTNRTPQKRHKSDSPAKSSSSSSSVRKPVVVTGSQTLFGTVDGTLGVVLGLDGPTAAFFVCLERAMATVITPVGGFSHQLYRARQDERRMIESHGFCDGDLVESFLDHDRSTMESVVREMNRDGGWEVDDAFAQRRSDEAGNNRDSTGDAVDEDDQERPELSVDDVLAMVEEITMLH